MLASWRSRNKPMRQGRPSRPPTLGEMSVGQERESGGGSGCPPLGTRLAGRLGSQWEQAHPSAAMGTAAACAVVASSVTTLKISIGINQSGRHPLHLYNASFRDHNQK
jgi:hypothetical protein